MGNLKEAFGENLRKVRKSRGLTQQALADILDTTVQTISNLECGKHWPSVETVEDLLSALKAQPSELFGFAWVGRRRK